MNRLGFQARIVLISLAAGLPACAALLVLLWTGDQEPRVRYGLSLLAVGALSGGLILLYRKLTFQFQTLANVVSALREGDFSIRARGGADKGLGEFAAELNVLGEVLRRQRLGAVEAAALLQKVMKEIDVAVFAFDDGQRLRLINRTGQRLLGIPGADTLEKTAAELDLKDCLKGEPVRTLQIQLPGGSGRWGMRRSGFREQGRPHHLVVLADLNQTLREEERQAWRRLIRVLGHELNNSLTPIKSIAGSPESLLEQDLSNSDREQDLREGLHVISSRAQALSRFMGAYSRLARLPSPNKRAISIENSIRKVVSLETRMPVAIRDGRPVRFRADPDQLEQMLINLVRNAVDAAAETGGGASIGWRRVGDQLEVSVDDEGKGLADTANLFVPFFTTKPQGSGIGLVLARQIAEAHGGFLTLANRKETTGCRALLVLPTA